VDIAIHTNANQPHQVKQAEIFRKGFLKHNIKANVTTSVQQEADVHVVLGPNYAKANWINHDRVILLDRNFYNSYLDHVSIGWMNKNGGRDYKVGAGRKALIIREPHGTKSLFLADYNGITEPADIVRLHPCNETHKSTLQHDINQCNRAIGYNSTALVEAALCGLEITCKGKNSILTNDNWLELLPYANWHYNEIESGEVWEHLQS